MSRSSVTARSRCWSCRICSASGARRPGPGKAAATSGSRVSWVCHRCSRLRAMRRSWATSFTLRPPVTSATASFLNWGVNVRRIRLGFLAMRHLLESTY
jgi:hypothetical protein